MKKLIPLMLIICLLLPSCQLHSRQAEITESSQALTESLTLPDISQTEETEAITEEDTAHSGISAVITGVTSAVVSVISPERPSQMVTSAAEKTTSAKTTSQKATTVRATTKAATTSAPKTNPQTTAKPSAESAELRGVWISCYDHISAQGKTREEYKAQTDKMFKTIKDCGLNTAFVHLRAFSDAFYKSDIYPYSAYIAGTEGASLSFDPFEVMLESSKKYGISVHGWINPFRVSTNKDPSLLSAQNPAKKILDSGNEDGAICILSNGIYYNPACTSNHKLIIDGVREIISKYDIDGIHIDDYFYPSTSESIDKIQYSQYKADGGTLSLSQWRQNCVNAFVSALWSAVKTADSSLTVSISPAAKLEKNKSELYADCELWLSRSGYADLIIPQIYFGFRHETMPFASLLGKWGSLPRNSSVKLACGLAAYKCGKADEYAGNGKTEWQDNTDILARQLSSIRKNKNYSGFVVFSYQDLTRSGCKEEIQNLKDSINSTGNGQ